jgi:prepilin-type N-terminal cleavage/methylation domain-containing protein
MRARGELIDRLRNRGFSLVELVIVVVIIGIIAAIAVPRISGAASGSHRNALMQSVVNVRKSIEHYYAEHGRYPGYNGGGSADATFFVRQLTEYTDADGTPNATPSSTFRFGPYLRPPFPTNPLNDLDTVHVKTTAADANPADGSVGWIAVLSTGAFGISATAGEIARVKLDAKQEADAKGRISG